ncbi:transcriptional regulator [Vandammella animalimorsus]|uniref:Transcriptional regulator n=1 Tax=Vandammella animalimorsus TaxID=2029117 RepID=A0A2A2ABM1_9BURK|nr:transcriptional regulator [Vandammella animalimorsus]
MKNRSDQGARRRAYVDTPKTGNAERSDFSCLPQGLGPAGAAHSVGNPRKASQPCCGCRLVLGPCRPQRDLLASCGQALKFSLTVCWNAFSRWAVRCMAAAGVPDLTFTDVLVLHHINHRGRGKKLADICFVLNYEDTHVVNYALKKLVAAGLAVGEKTGKEVFYSPTERGQQVAERYRQVREQCLIDSVNGELNPQIGELARFLRLMSGLYDQAARAASSL